MRCFCNATIVALSVTGLLMAGIVVALAQSGAPSARPPGAGQRSGQAAPVALEGYCPVSVIEMRKWVKGDPAHRSEHDGLTYLFADAQGKQMFDANPAKYVPALGGDCVVALVEMGQRVPGNIRHASIHEGRLFLFSDAKGHKMFRGEPAKYADADLAYGGNCVVCRVDMQRDMPGKPELTVVHKGLRYLFPSEDQRDAFLANPAEYEVESPADATPEPGSPPISRPEPGSP